MSISDRSGLKKKIRIISSSSSMRLSSTQKNIPGCAMAYAQSGFAGECKDDERHIAYPSAGALGCSFDPLLAEKIGTACGEDLHSENVTMAIVSGFMPLRDPLSARGAYLYSEDVLHAGKMSEAMINGLRKRGISAVVDSGGYFDSDVPTKMKNNILDARLLREVFEKNLPSFIRKCTPVGIIAPAGRINGINFPENEKAVSRFRKISGFGGLIFSAPLSDVCPVKAVNSGVMPVMTDHPEKTGLTIAKAFERGDISAEKISTLAGKVAGASKVINRSADVRFMHDRQVNHTIAKDAARDCFVLLKNNGILPLKKGTSLEIIGKNARDPFVQLRGRYHVKCASYPFVTTVSAYGGGRYLGDFPRVDTSHSDIKESEDIFILFMGNTEETTDEFSRAEAVSSVQKDVLRALYVQNKKIICVITSPAVPAVDFGEYADAIIYDPLCGEGSAEALCDILYGLYSPTGRLARSIAYDVADYPSYKYCAADANVIFSESVLSGYKYFTLGSKKAAYPFGHGLTYSEFSYSSASCSGMKRDGFVDVSFCVKNTGNVYTAEVVQVYLRDLDGRVFRPGRELKYFEKIFLSPGEEKTVSLKLAMKEFMFYDTQKRQMSMASSGMSIDIGSSSEDIRISLPVTILADEIYSGIYSPAVLPSYFPKDGKRLTVSNHDYRIFCGDYTLISPAEGICPEMTVADARKADSTFDNAVNELYEKLHYQPPRKGEFLPDKDRKMKMLLAENMSLEAFGRYYSHLIARPKKAGEALRIVLEEEK